MPDNGAADALRQLLDPCQIDRDLFEGPLTDEPWPRLFGGQAVAQAVAAAGATVEVDRLLHSLHAYFLAPGDPKRTLRLAVIRLRDGKAFSQRRITATQDGVLILELVASYQVQESGYSHATAMPNVAMPDDLEPSRDKAFALLNDFPPSMRPSSAFLAAFDIRVADPGGDDGMESFSRKVWLHMPAALADNPRLQEAALVYCSDFSLIGTAIAGHHLGESWNKIRGGSLDHALWLHRHHALNDWLLYAHHSPWTGAGRGYVLGQFFSRDGLLVGSTAQEGLIRPIAAG